MTNKQNFVPVQVTLGADVANGGTFAVSYPEGYNLGDFENAVGHHLSLNGTLLAQGTDIGLSFGASSVTVTNNTGGTLPAHSKGYMQLEISGSAAPIVGKKNRRQITPIHAASVHELLIDFGAPAQADADGIWDGVDAGATAVTYGVADMASTANDGVLDVPRNLTMVGSAGADHVVTFTGFDEYGEELSETLTANGATPVIGNKAFAQVVTMSIAAGGQAGDTLDVGWGDKFGLPVRVESQMQVVAEIIDGVIKPVPPAYVKIPFAVLEAAVDAGTSKWVHPGFAGSVIDMSVVAQGTVTTGGTFTVEIGGTAVDGLTVTVADGAVAGEVDTDTATADHATAVFTAAQPLEIVPSAAFNAAADFDGAIGVRRSALTQFGTLTTGLAKNTAGTATNADVRGTYLPSTVADGSISYGLIVRTAEPQDLGNVQYAA